MHYSVGRTPIDSSRSRRLRRKTGISIGGSFLVLLLCNYVTLICHMSVPSDLGQDTIRSIDSSFSLSSRIETKYFNNATVSSAAISLTKSTNIWKEILKNKTTTSRIGIHVLRPMESVKSIIVLGERHSGTTFFTKYLSNCFPNLHVRDTFVNNKHWIQYGPDYVQGVVSKNLSSTPSLWLDIVNHNDGIFGEHPSMKAEDETTNLYFKNSIVIVLFRNPYDWVEAMRRKPWHWPNHISLFPFSEKNVSLTVKVHSRHDGASDSIGGRSVQKSYVGHDVLDWKDFISRPLNLEDDEGYIPQWQKLIKNADDSSSDVCQMGYALNSINPCRANFNYVPKSIQSIPKAFLRHLPFDTHNPIYEQNSRDGGPFENILQLRTEKIRNFLSLPEQWELAGIGFIQYERLLGNNLKSLIEEISTSLRIPSDNENQTNYSTCPSIPHFEKTPYNLTDDFTGWITKSAQWNVEKFIGFHRSES